MTRHSLSPPQTLDPLQQLPLMPDPLDSWPSNGARAQRFRARWPDGAMNTEFFDSNTPPPQAIAIVSPSVGNYRDIWTTPAKKELQIKKGP